MPPTIAAPPRIDGYTFIRTLGTGSTATVHLYRQERPDRFVAVKVSKQSLGPGMAARLTREADTMTRLSRHPYIVPVHGAGITRDGLGYIVFGYAPNGTYKQLTRRRPLTCDGMLDLGVKLASALQTAHRAGVIHHDIKTGNVLVGPQGQPLLADFGIATDPYDKTFTGYSLPWAPPEVLVGHAGAEAADIYSLGATLYATLVGTSPFEHGRRPDTPERLRELILAGSPPPIGRGDVPADVEDVLRRAMARDPDDRYHSALGFARAMQHVQWQRFGHTTPVMVEGQRPYPARHGSGGGNRPARRGRAARHKAPALARTAAAAGRAALLATVAIALVAVAAPRMGRLLSSVSPPARVRTAPAGEGNGAETAPDAAAGAVPSPIDLVGSYNDDGTVTFTWGNPQPQAGDSYVWRIDGDEGADGEAPLSATTEATATFAARKDASRTCIRVSIVRADRRISTRPSTTCAIR